MLRNAVSGDEVAIEEFLSKHACTSMFLRSNLSQFGLSGSDDPRATTFWLDENVGEIQGVFGASRKGFLMFQAPVATPQDWIDFATVLSGRSVQGMTGEGAQVAAALPAIGFEGREFALKSVESLYQLELEALKMPEANGDIRPAQEHDRELLAEWVLDYDVKTL
ncbi:MAG: hypothetical protein P8L32_08440, partial [Paracoccaceae bacterium]|nr:hypothetical protein [Paracoccaceae bacterium]